ncbi:MAG TPA: xanthine dehydrogenase family protein subunit M [Acidimicrobiales bacterium]|nr:xanthine dehydrogenase family protein subunit M [Acidimicrobiales bacterium]
MIPATFEYARPEGLAEALALLADQGEEAKVLAGGHSLLPLMKLRFATPPLLVDIGRLGELAHVTVGDGEVVIGALTRHHDLARDPLVAERLPLLALAASRVGDPQVRHRGTIGGSAAHGDPASDLPAVLLALGASFVLASALGERVVPAASFFEGFLETSLRPDELLTEIHVPDQISGFGFEKFTRRAQDWAIVGVAVGESAAGLGVALVNMGQTPLRASATEAALAAGASAEEAAALADEGTSPISDLNASEEYRRHLARVLTRRALEAAGR